MDGSKEPHAHSLRDLDSALSERTDGIGQIRVVSPVLGQLQSLLHELAQRSADVGSGEKGFMIVHIGS